MTSVGATSSCEAVRRKTRNDLARRAARTFREIAPDQDRIRVAIAGLGLITLLEIVSRSRLDLDASYRTLGPVRFRATAGAAGRGPAALAGAARSGSRADRSAIPLVGGYRCAKNIDILIFVIQGTDRPDVGVRTRGAP